MSERESLFKKAIHDWFGSEIARSIRAEQSVIPSAYISQISERELHPFIVPIYKNLIKLDISTAYWSQVLQIILSCKCVRKQKINQVYKRVYKTLTGRAIQVDTFYLLPDHEQKLWIDNYVESDEVITDPRKNAEHNKLYLQLCISLTEFCQEI